MLGEKGFRREVVGKLEELGFRVVSLGTGTFDAYVEFSHVFLEFKKLKSNANYSFGIKFTKEQYDAMRKLFRKPIVVVFGENPERYYVLSSEDVDELLWKGGTWISEKDFPVSSRCESIEEVVRRVVELLVGKVGSTSPHINLNFLNFEREDDKIILLMLTNTLLKFFEEVKEAVTRLHTLLSKK